MCLIRRNLSGKIKFRLSGIIRRFSQPCAAMPRRMFFFCLPFESLKGHLTGPADCGGDRAASSLPAYAADSFCPAQRFSAAKSPTPSALPSQGGWTAAWAQPRTTANRRRAPCARAAAAEHKQQAIHTAKASIQKRFSRHKHPAAGTGSLLKLCFIYARPADAL